MHDHLNVKLYHDARSPERQIISRCTVIRTSNYITMHGHLNVKLYHDARSPERQITLLYFAPLIILRQENKSAAPHETVSPILLFLSCSSFQISPQHTVREQLH